MSYYEETLQLIETRKGEIADKFAEECKKLLRSGAVDKESHNRGLLFGVAIENIADDYLFGERKGKEYRNLKCF
jgi:ATP-dependent protease Clp ATPase subunit